MVEGYQPVAKLAEQRVRAKLRTPGLLGPVRPEVDQDLANSESYLKGIGQLFTKYGIDGFQEPLERLRPQIGAYNEFVRKVILPRTRTDFRLPAEMYANSLSNVGVDIAPDQLARQARNAFAALQQQDAAARDRCRQG